MSFIVEILEKHKVDYKTLGSDYVISCLNPEHEDNNPSLHIDINTGMFNCFSCGFSGNLSKLLILLGEEAPAQHMFLSVKINKIKQKINKLQQLKIELPKDADFNIAPIRDISEQTFRTHKAFTTKELTEFKDRICFPIYNNMGELHFIEGTSTKTDLLPKYLRKPSGTNINFLHNANCGAPIIVLVEGLFDYLQLYDLGIRNASCLFGANTFNKPKMADVKLYGFQGIISMLDNDEAGQSASNKINSYCLKNNLIYKRVLPITDPGDIKSQDTLENIVKQSNCIIKDGYILCH